MSENKQEVITASEVATAKTERRSLVAAFADRYGIEPNRMMATLRATVIRPDKNGNEATNEQIASFLIVANQHNLNPFTKEIHAFLGKGGGIVCVVGVDGWAKKANEHPQFDGVTFEQDDQKCTCSMFRKDRAHPIVVTEYHAECVRPTEPWSTHPKRMLRHRAMVQCARLAFSFAGIYDPDEAEGILAAEDAVDITPPKPILAITDEGKPEFRNADGTPYQPPTTKISPVRMRKIVEGMLEAVAKDDAAALKAIEAELSNDEKMLVGAELRSWEATSLRKLREKGKLLPGPDLDAWAVTAINGAKDGVDLLASWEAVQGAYQEADKELPPDVEIVYIDRKQALGMPSDG